MWDRASPRGLWVGSQASKGPNPRKPRSREQCGAVERMPGEAAAHHWACSLPSPPDQGWSPLGSISWGRHAIHTSLVAPNGRNYSLVVPGVTSLQSGQRGRAAFKGSRGGFLSSSCSTGAPGGLGLWLRPSSLCLHHHMASPPRLALSCLTCPCLALISTLVIGVRAT